MKQLFNITALLLFAACASEPVKHEAPQPLVTRSMWVSCWEKCGKKDKLTSVNGSACVCSNGDVIRLVQPQLPETPLKDEPPSKSILDSIKGWFT